MELRTLETDYLVIGAGAAGMAFTDSLITHGQHDVLMVDRRHAPGGHWLEAYPFVRLHQPSAYYGVNSLPLGTDTLDTHGPNAGYYEQASAAEICSYYARVMEQRFLPSGRVRYFPMCEHTGAGRCVSLLSGEAFEVKVRKKVVDARYVDTAVPNSSAPPFEVASGARCVPVNALVQVKRPSPFVIVGAGKTAMDACVWLLRAGVAPSDICWIKPREAWLQNRKFMQGGELVGTFLEGLALQLEAAAEASSLTDLFERLAAKEQFLRVDDTVVPTMYRGPTLSEEEVTLLRRITNVVRLGKVRRIERSAIVLERGTVPTSPDAVHVHCATLGLNPAPAVPIFSDEQIVLQSIRTGLIPFNTALIGYVEATREDTAEKNRLCPPNRQPNTPADWARGMIVGMGADHLWSKQPDIADWLDSARLNPTRGLRKRAGEPQIRANLARFAQLARPALANLAKLSKIG